MKKIALLFTLTLCADALNGMEVPKPKPQPSVAKVVSQDTTGEAGRPDYMAMLPTEIKKEIVLALVQSSTVEEAVNAISLLTETNKEFNKIINDPITMRTIISLLVQKFNAPSAYIAQQLSTPGSKNYINLSLSLMTALLEQKFEDAEKFINFGADINFQADTYPIYCNSKEKINDSAIALTELYNKIVRNIMVNQAEWQFKQDMLWAVKDLNIKHSFSNEQFNQLLAAINKPDFKQVRDIVKSALTFNGYGLTAFYHFEDDTVCMVGAKLSLVMYSILNDQPTLLKWLINHNADLNLTMGNGDTALLMAITIGSKKEIIELLIKNGTNVNSQKLANKELVNKAKEVELNNIELKHLGVESTKFFMMGPIVLNNFKLTCSEKLQDVMSDLFEGETPLTALLYTDHFTYEEKYDLVKLLLDKGADLNLQDSLGNTPLMLLSDTPREGISIIMKLLLDHDANPSIKNNVGKTALDYLKYGEEDEEDPEREEKIQLLENTIKKQQKK